MEQTQKIRTLKTQIVGLHYAKSTNFVSLLPLDSNLAFQFEPNNLYDPNAVSISYAKFKLGYIPKFQTKIIRNFVENGFDIRVKSRNFTPKTILPDFDIIPARLNIIIYFTKRKD